MIDCYFKIKGQSTNKYNNMDKSQKPYAKLKKPDTKDYRLYDFNDMRF